MSKRIVVPAKVRLSDIEGWVQITDADDNLMLSINVERGSLILARGGVEWKDQGGGTYHCYKREK